MFINGLLAIQCLSQPKVSDTTSFESHDDQQESERRKEEQDLRRRPAARFIYISNPHYRGTRGHARADRFRDSVPEATEPNCHQGMGMRGPCRNNMLVLAASELYLVSAFSNPPLSSNDLPWSSGHRAHNFSA